MEAISIFSKIILNFFLNQAQIKHIPCTLFCKNRQKSAKEAKQEFLGSSYDKIKRNTPQATKGEQFQNLLNAQKKRYLSRKNNNIYETHEIINQINTDLCENHQQRIKSKTINNIFNK